MQNIGNIDMLTKIQIPVLRSALSHMVTWLNTVEKVRPVCSWSYASMHCLGIKIVSYKWKNCNLKRWETLPASSPLIFLLLAGNPFSWMGITSESFMLMTWKWELPSGQWFIHTINTFGHWQLSAHACRQDVKHHTEVRKTGFPTSVSSYPSCGRWMKVQPAQNHQSWAQLL